MSDLLNRLNWTNTLFLVGNFLLSILGTLAIFLWGEFHYQTLILLLVFGIISSLAITGGYHRLFSHRSYEGSFLLRAIMLLLAASVVEGSALEWSCDHRRHHRYTDTDRDPYNIQQGFWHAHMGWLFFLNISERDFQNVKDLASDRLVALQHKFFPYLAAFMGFILPTLIATCWGDPLGGFIIAGSLRISILHQCTFFVNSLCHTLGSRPFSEQQSARDNWLTAFVTFGEGFHNYHHQFMFDYRNGIRFYDFDPTKWLIFLLASVRLAKNLKRAKHKQVVHYRIRATETHLFEKIERYSDQVKSKINAMLEPCRTHLLEAAARFEQIEADYLNIRKQPLQLSERQQYKKIIQEKQKQLRNARSEFNLSFQRWRDTCRQALYALKHINLSSV